MLGLATISLLVTLIFVVAGTVKGVTGMGLPMIAMGLLGLVMTPAEAATLLVVPSLVTNVWQCGSGPHRGRLLRRIWPMLLAMSIATLAGIGLLAGGDTGRATMALGLVLMAYAGLGLARIRLAVSRRMEPVLAPLIGAATGLIAGATGTFAIPAVPYLQALGLEKEDLVQALGLSFTIATVALTIGLASHGALHLAVGGASILCTAPALAGMGLGRWVRIRVDAATFRRLFFIGLLGLGADLVARVVM